MCKKSKTNLLNRKITKNRLEKVKELYLSERETVIHTDNPSSDNESNETHFHGAGGKSLGLGQTEDLL